jgi:hypothetical protein
MKNALISPEEFIYNKDRMQIGIRIAEVRQDVFEVAPPLYWVECDDIVTAENWYYNGADFIENTIEDNDNDSNRNEEQV